MARPFHLELDLLPFVIDELGKPHALEGQSFGVLKSSIMPFQLSRVSDNLNRKKTRTFLAR